MKKYKIKSFCKINLTLRVVKKLKNGYHNIKSLITFCNLYDEISLNKINGIKDKIVFSGRFKEGINSQYNTISKTLDLLRKKNFLKKVAFKISVKKNIPHGSGLGGGSINAASLLGFFKSEMHLKINKNQIKKIASNIGFDVPIGLEKKNTLVTGKGREIIRINKNFNLNILIVYPKFICSTKKIYQKNKKISDLKYLSNFRFNSKNKLLDYLKSESNDLQDAAIDCYPQISKIIKTIKAQKDCHFSRITGSGSASIGIFSNMAAAIAAQKLVKLKYPKYWSIVSKTI